MPERSTREKKPVGGVFGRTKFRLERQSGGCSLDPDPDVREHGFRTTNNLPVKTSGTQLAMKRNKGRAHPQSKWLYYIIFLLNTKRGKAAT
jgi:hypothetical protein